MLFLVTTLLRKLYGKRPLQAMKSMLLLLYYLLGTSDPDRIREDPDLASSRRQRLSSSPAKSAGNKRKIVQVQRVGGAEVDPEREV